MTQLVTWHGSGLDGMRESIRRSTRPGVTMTRVGNSIGRMAVAQYKMNHRWRNRTGRLEASISVRVKVSGARVTITLYANMYYGIYVETRWGGAYSSLMPALYAVAPWGMTIFTAEFMKGFAA